MSDEKAQRRVDAMRQRVARLERYDSEMRDEGADIGGDGVDEAVMWTRLERILQAASDQLCTYASLQLADHDVALFQQASDGVWRGCGRSWVPWVCVHVCTDGCVCSTFALMNVN